MVDAMFASGWIKWGGVAHDAASHNRLPSIEIDMVAPNVYRALTGC
jgi:hypothetical protein